MHTHNLIIYAADTCSYRDLYDEGHDMSTCQPIRLDWFRLAGSDWLVQTRWDWFGLAQWISKGLLVVWLWSRQPTKRRVEVFPPADLDLLLPSPTPSQPVQVMLCLLSGVLAIIQFGTILLMMPSPIRVCARSRVKVVKSVGTLCRESTLPI